MNAELACEPTLRAPAFEADDALQWGEVRHGQDLRDLAKSLQQDFAGGFTATMLRAMESQVDDRPEPEESARRIRAAQAYAKLSRAEMAEAIGRHPSVYDEMTGKRRQLRGASWDELRAIAERCGLPFEFFWADFKRLPEIAPADASPALLRLGSSAERLRAREREAARQAREDRRDLPRTTGAPRGKRGQGRG